MSLRERLAKHDRKLRPTANPCANALKRLTKGQGWLTDTRARLEAMPDYGVGSALEAQYVNALEGWVALERQTRFIFGYGACIHGTGHDCPDDAPVACEACAVNQRELVEVAA